jgi:antitoxin (DNA-binding transcriptional repressor) of toxin-antitoxin stability system
MQQIEISEAKIQLTALLDAAINGADILITQDSRPLVRLSHVNASLANLDQTNGASAAPIVSEVQAQAEASLFLSDRLPDRISAGTPRLDATARMWRVPVILAYPRLGVLGEVGEITVSASEKEILSHTPVEKMRKAAGEIIEKHRHAIEAPDLPAAENIRCHRMNSNISSPPAINLLFLFPFFR